MNWPKRKLFSLVMTIAGLLFISACGVKGDPLPPERPVELGRGRPTYKRATEGLRIEKSKPVKPVKTKKNEDEDDGEN